MKDKLTVSVDRLLVKFGKEYAACHGTSLSRIIEDALRRITRSGMPRFSRKWRGKFSARKLPGDERMHYLKKRHS